MTQTTYEIPYNTQLGDKLKDVLGDKANRKSFVTSRKLFNKARFSDKKGNEFKLPPLSRLEKDGIDHINIALNRENVARLVALDDALEFELKDYGKFNTMKGFWFYISTAEKDENLRVFTGSKLRELSKKLTPIKVKDFKVKILEALWEKVIQYKESDQLRDSTLPFDYYFISKDDFKKRLPYSPWYVEGVEIIRNALRSNQLPDFSKFKDEDKFSEIIDDFKVPDEKRFNIPRVIKNHIVAESFTKSLKDYKKWLCKPINRVKLQFTLLGVKAIENIVNRTLELHENRDLSVGSIVGLVSEICSACKTSEYILHNRDIKGNKFLDIFRRLKEDLVESNPEEHILSIVEDIEKSIVILDGVCIDKEGLHPTLKEFVYSNKHDGKDIFSYYESFVNFLKEKEAVSEEFLNLIPKEYSITNKELNKFLVVIKTDALREIKSSLKTIVSEYIMDKDLISNLDDKDIISTLSYGEFFGNKGINYLVSENSLLDLYLTIKRNTIPEKIAEENDEKKLYAYVMTGLLTARLLSSYFRRLNEEENDEILTELKPLNNNDTGINNFLDTFRSDFISLISYY